MRFRLLAFIVLALSLVALPASPARADADIGDSPAFIVKTLDGKPFDLSKLKGKVVLINFWATWCPPCRWEMPALEAVWREYHSKGLVMIAVSADRPRGRGAVVDVMRYFTFPAAMLDDVMKNELVTVNSVPVTFLLGKDGKLADIITLPSRPLTAATLGDEVKALLDVKYEDKSDKKADEKPDAKKDGDSETKADGKS